MLQNYLKLALRRLQKERLFTLLNITGLTVGIAAFILLFVYVRHELSYDTFHSNAEDIYVIGFEANGRNGATRWERYMSRGGELMRDRIPEMEMMTQVSGLRGSNLVKIGESSFYESEIIQTDDKFFKVFDFEMLSGVDKLDEPDKAVITSSMSHKYFGDESPIGKLIEIDGYGEFEVTGLMNDPPANSHLQFKLIVSNYQEVQRLAGQTVEVYRWGTLSYHYVMFADGVDPDQVQLKMDELGAADFPKGMTEKLEDGRVTSRTFLHPFTDIHLRSDFSSPFSPTSSMLYIYVFSSIGVLILFIACFNYINLITARSIKKSKEIGLRKVVGAKRREIIFQQMTEAGLFTFLSVVLAFAMSERLLPLFNDMIGTRLELSYQSIDFILLVSGLTLVVSFIAGYYPAFRLSKFSPVNGLRGSKAPKGKTGMRRGLVLFQFFITQGLIICTFIIQSQLSYLQHKSLGYNREHTLFIDTHGELKDRGGLFRSELESIPGVKNVSMSDGRFDWNAIIFLAAKDIEGFAGTDTDDIVPSVFHVDSSFVKTMDMKTVAGRAFHELENPTTAHIMVNETIARLFGWKDPVGKTINIFEEKRTVVGVVQDFHDESLKVEVKPAILMLEENPNSFANVRLNASNITETLDAIEDKWDALVPERPFGYQFYDAFYDAQYKKEQRLGNIFNAFSAVAISISILGLIGLTTFSAQQRLKEFGVRKVLGAKVVQLVGLLSKEFMWLMGLGFVLVAPVTYYFMNDWLTEFVYRIDIGATVYLLAVLTTMLICVFTVGFQAFKVTRFNPSEVLRNE